MAVDYCIKFARSGRRHWLLDALFSEEFDEHHGGFSSCSSSRRGSFRTFDGLVAEFAIVLAFLASVFSSGN